MTRDRAVRWIVAVARQPEVLAFLPALSLAAYWLGGEHALLVTALAVPLLCAIAAVIAAASGVAPPQSDGFDARLRAMITRAEEIGGRTGCVVLLVDDGDALAHRLGQRRWADAMGQVQGTLRRAMRDGDLLHRCDTGGFVVVLSPSRSLDIEAALQIALRLQEAVSRITLPFDAPIRLGVSAGICLSDGAPESGAAALLDAARQAARGARRAGPQGVRAYTAARSRPPAAQPRSSAALFQPRLCTDTGSVAGFALSLGDQAGSALAGEAWPDLLAQGLRALSGWERADVQVRCVILACPAEALRDPSLAAMLEWELDRFDQRAHRLALAPPRDAIANPDPETTQTLGAIARLGCVLDVTDGHGAHECLPRLRKHGKVRLGLDATRFRHLDSDPHQQRAAAAALARAEKLDLTSFAEGVATAGAHATLAQLGCGEVQGPAIAHAMPFDETLGWARANDRRLQHAARLGDTLR